MNAVVFRRTKADACRPDGTPLFTRRFVHTESFTMTSDERLFYNALKSYLEDGFALARRQGNQGRSLGFVMTIFQKIAASSFAAVRRTLRRRLLMLPLHEAILKDQELDIDGREELLEETRALIHQEHDLPDDTMGRSETERVLAELKVKLLKKLDEDELALASDAGAGEAAAATGEDSATLAVRLALPEERLRISELLDRFPLQRETKVAKLLRALGALWEKSSKEKIVIFATYLGTVDLLGREIDSAYPGQGVVVLRGGDHGAKLAAERRFRRADGPRVLVCTAAGREGINLQNARVLFNFDLPWNPMDLEQRIGRIHRYGQKHTAQVYNLVLSDTIEGSIFLLLMEKLEEIARALGKVDEQGNVAEDLRTQILGQLTEKLSYDKLYQEALSDPELRRTRQELEVALQNAHEARQVVFELFQDLEGFSLEDYKPFADIESGFDRVVHFLHESLTEEGQSIQQLDEPNLFSIVDSESAPQLRFTIDRDLARDREDLDLMGLDHPRVQAALVHWQDLAPEEVGVVVEGDEGPAVLSSWWIETRGKSGEKRSSVRSIAVRPGAERLVQIERKVDDLYRRSPAQPMLSSAERRQVFREQIEPMLRRDLHHRGLVPAAGGFSSKLIGWLEIVNRPPPYRSA